jgi:alkylglycerol monooxygenase
MPTWALAAVVAVGATHLLAWLAGQRALASVTKAIPILLLAAVAAAAGGTYGWLVAAGLVCSAVGDVCLLSDERFVAGLASFLVGHLCYLAAFTLTGPGLVPDWRWGIVLGMLSGGLLAVLWGPLPADFRAPVVVYVGVISAMAFAATSRAATQGTPPTSGVLAATGALWFLASDAILALDRFVRPLPRAHLWVMVTYYAAQTCIAASVG